MPSFFRMRYLLIVGALAMSVLMWVDRACISAAKDEIRESFGLTDVQMGVVLGAFSLGYALLQVPSGVLADRLGPRLVMTLVCAAWSLLTLATGLVRGYAALVGVRFAFGAGEAGGYPTLTRALAEWLPPGERGVANSASFSGGRLGAALAMPLVVALIETLGGWRPTFMFFGVVGLAVAGIWYVCFRNRPEEHPWVSDQETDEIRRQQAAAGAAGTGGYESRTLIDVASKPDLWLLMYQYVAHNFTFFFTVSWFFPYLKDAFGLTATQTAWGAAAPLLCGVVGNWTAGITVDRLYARGRWRASRRIPAAIGFVLAAIGMAGCIHMSSPVTAVACMCIAIFGSDMVLSPSWSTCMDLGGPAAGSVSGSMNMIGNLGAFTTALAFPSLHEWWGSHELFFYLAAGLNLVAVACWFFIRPDRFSDNVPAADAHP